MTGQNYLRVKRNQIKWFSALLMILVAAMAISSCTKTPQPYNIIKFYGNSDVMNYSRSLNIVMYKADSANPATLLVKEGDIFGYDDFVFQYIDLTQDSFSLKTTSKTSFINGKLSEFSISKRDTAEIFLSNILKQDISSLEMIHLASPVPESALHYMAEIAKVKPEISLGLDGPINQYVSVLNLFKLKFLLLNDNSTDDLKELSLYSPEILMLMGSDTLIKTSLPPIPSLRQIILYTPDAFLTGDFLSKNPQIEQLTFFGSGGFDFAVLEPLKELEELILSDNDTIINQDLLKNCKSLEILAILSQKFKYDSTLDDLKNIRWMTFSQYAVQSDFDRFIGNHPGLEVVEIINNEEVKSLKSLSSLKNLYGLTITHKLVDTTSILSLNNLKYLSLPEDYLDNKLNHSELIKALPNTAIVPNEGFCLGSGWLILLIPFVLLFRSFSIKKRC